jgi:putative molybdopterin biosynthesis protein
MDRNIYLKTIPLAEALHKLKKELDRNALVGGESLPVHEALDRVTSRAVIARASSPTFHAAAMDGIAVHAESTFAAREDQPLRLTRDKDFVWVNTGNALPADRDAVIMVENLIQDGEDVLIEGPAFPWQNVRRIGEDIVATELIMPRNHALSEFDLAALLTGGIFDVDVYETVRMRVIPTGDEVLDYTRRPEPAPGEVIESNSVLLCSMAQKRGVRAERVPPVADSLEAIEAEARKALDDGMHVVVIGAGSSAGSKDFTRAVMERLGKVVVHGVSAMPGKPSLLGVAENGALLVGAPGYPVSAVVCFEKLVLPLCDWLERRTDVQREILPVTLTRSIPSKLGREEFVRLAIGRAGTRWVGTPLGRGAGMITSLTKAQGMARIPANSEGMEAGATLTAELLVSRRNLEQTLICVGSHDNTLDLLADELMEPSMLPRGARDRAIRLTSTHVGSMGGIMALKNGSAMCAGAHLFDPASGDFNFPFLKKYAPEMRLVVVNLAIRHQGLIVPKGNPKNISGIADLASGNIRFINRQRGAGTRILLDHHLDKADISPDQVPGYDKEEFTHMAVAVNVLTGAADCGLGIYAAAKALDLDFVPLARERYDVIIPWQYMDDPKIRVLLQLLEDDAIRDKIEKLGGYETNLTGRIMHEGEGLGEA